MVMGSGKGATSSSQDTDMSIAGKPFTFSFFLNIVLVVISNSYCVDFFFFKCTCLAYMKFWSIYFFFKGIYM